MTSQLTDDTATPTFQHPAYPATAPTWTPYPTSGPYREPVSNTAATWAFALALIPIPLGWLVSVGLAIAVLRDSRDGRGVERGRWMAVTALVVVPLWTLLMLVAVASGGLVGGANRDASGELTTSGYTPTTSLRVGDCLPAAPVVERMSRTVEVVPCSEKHVGEVFATFELPDGPFPGEADVARLAEGGCLERDDGTARPARDAELYSYFPVRSTWSSDRGVVCMAFDGISAAS